MSYYIAEVTISIPDRGHAEPMGAYHAVITAEVSASSFETASGEAERAVYKLLDLAPERVKVHSITVKPA